MTTMRWPDHLIDLAEWDAFGEQEGRFELVEGALRRPVNPDARHQLLAAVLMRALDEALPPEWCVVPSIEVTIDDGPTPTVRVPDVVVLRASAADHRPRQDPADVLAVVEILAPGTRRVDRVVKRGEYAEAGIAHYLLVDYDAPVTATELQLVDGAYRTLGEHRGQAHLFQSGPDGVPGGVAVDLDAHDRRVRGNRSRPQHIKGGRR